MLTEMFMKFSIHRTWKNDIANIQGKLKQCEVRHLSIGQKKDILDFYEKLIGKKVPTYWHEYFYSRNEFFSVKYIPTCLYHSDVIYKLNNYKLRHAYVDKSIYDVYFPDVLRPKTFVNLRPISL